MRLAIAPLPLLGAALVAGPGGGACSGGTVVETRAVTLHAPAACASGASPYALGLAPYALFQALGDFEPQGSPASLPLSSTGAVLAGFPSDTQEIVATMTGASSAQWAAHAVLGGGGDVDLLALPFRSPCPLSDAIDARTNGAFGAIDAAHALLAGGTSSSGVPRTSLVDLSRGTVHSLADGLLVPRTSPTVTAWTGGAIVAGGIQLDGSGPSFEIYSTSLGDFDGATHPLSQVRARHGAVVLASGETLLVGGVDANGDVLGSMEAIDPVAGRARTGGLALLAVPRADPIVLRLASGEVLVAGGVDGTGQPVTTLEWLTADGSQREKTSDLVASLHEAVVPLAAGGALAVVAPSAPSSGFQSVWVVSADGDVEAGTPVDGSLTDARLFEGTEQAPVLWTGDRWLVWQPWQGAFTALSPAIGASGPTGDPTVSPEPGLGVWLDGRTVGALRSGTRGPFATTAASSPLLVTDTSFTAPDRLVLAGAAGPITFDPTSGLALQPGASVFVTDATFASFALDLRTPGALPPAIVLRDPAGNETVLDPGSCAVPAGSSLHVERDGDAIRVSVDGGSLVTCAAAPSAGARVSIGVRGAATSGSVVRAVVVTRT